MTAYNIVRFRTKPGQEQAFIDAHKKADVKLSGLHKASLVKTGDRTYCFVGEWDLDGCDRGGAAVDDRHSRQLPATRSKTSAAISASPIRSHALWWST